MFLPLLFTSHAKNTFFADNGNERAVWFGVGFGTGLGVTVVICSGVLALVIGILVNQILKLKKKNLLTELGEK